MLTLYLTFGGTVRLFSKLAEPLYIPTSSVYKRSFATPWPILVIVLIKKSLYYHICLRGYKVVSHSGLDLHLPNNDDM
jgi:hypothetical protein